MQRSVVCEKCECEYGCVCENVNVNVYMYMWKCMYVWECKAPMHELVNVSKYVSLKMNELESMCIYVN